MVGAKQGSAYTPESLLILWYYTGNEAKNQGKGEKKKENCKFRVLLWSLRIRLHKFCSLFVFNNRQKQRRWPKRRRVETPQMFCPHQRIATGDIDHILMAK